MDYRMLTIFPLIGNDCRVPVTEITVTDPSATLIESPGARNTDVVSPSMTVIMYSRGSDTAGRRNVKPTTTASATATAQPEIIAIFFIFHSLSFVFLNSENTSEVLFSVAIDHIFRLYTAPRFFERRKDVPVYVPALRFRKPIPNIVDFG